MVHQYDVWRAGIVILLDNLQELCANCSTGVEIFGSVRLVRIVPSGINVSDSELSSEVVLASLNPQIIRDKSMLIVISWLVSQVSSNLET